ncbi:hypothetical protein ACIVBQ_000327 [Tenacibaculum discolor]
MKTITNKLKVALVAVGFLAVGTVSAQTTTGDIGRQAAGTLGSSTGYVKVIDNKGTVKYLQSTNGITQFTDTAPNGGVVTTWQLGGTLNTATTITTNGQNFTIDGNTFTLVGTDQVDAATVAAVDQVAATAYNGDGFTVLVKDETDGTVRKILAADLLQVQGIHATATVDAADQTANSKTITVTGVTATTSFYKVSVYRNGAKLVAGTDYTFGADSVTVAGGTNFNMYDGDQIEINYIR